ncbi:MAG: hypothetical protein U0U25_04825 [Flavobacteriales bacterium]
MNISRSLCSFVWLLYLSGGAAHAQCFPDSSAAWCFLSFDNSEIVHTRMLMEPESDTVILGNTYQRIEEYNDALGLETWQFVKRYYVRSDTDGKGYMMLLDSMQEYLVADVNAMPGDTIPNVLTADTWGWQTYWLKRVIVDSVRTIENNDVVVTRWYVHAYGWIPQGYSGYEIFWQAGIGNSYGPLLILSVANAFQELQCLRQQDTYVYSNQFSYPGLPGIPCDCPLESPLGLVEHPADGTVRVSPNPSSGVFELHMRMRSATVYDATGKWLFETSSPRIDLSAYSPGIYHALVRTPGGVRSVRLMVQR